MDGELKTDRCGRGHRNSTGLKSDLAGTRKRLFDSIGGNFLEVVRPFWDFQL